MGSVQVVWHRWTVLRIVAIGGGEIGRPGCAVETTELDAEVVRLAEKPSPRLVFVPATCDDAGYVATINAHYGRRLGCRVEPVIEVVESSHAAIARYRSAG